MAPQRKGMIERVLIWMWDRQESYRRQLEKIDSYFYGNSFGGDKE